MHVLRRLMAPKGETWTPSALCTEKLEFKLY